MDIKILTEKVERISQTYAGKYQIRRDQPWFVLKLQEEMGELIQSYLMMSGQARKKDKHAEELRREFEHEAADVLCHILLLIKHFHIDIDKVVEDKWLQWDEQNRP